MFKKENKILDLSGERKKREKEVEEIRRKMSLKKDLPLTFFRKKVRGKSPLSGGLIEKQQSQKLLSKLALTICDSFISAPIYFLVFLIPLFFLPFTFEIFEFNKQYLLWSLIAITLMAWLIKIAIIKKEFEFLKNPLNIPILILMIIFTLAAFLGIDSHSSIWGSYGWSSGNLLEMLSFGILFFIIINNVKKTNLSINRLLNVFLISGFFVVLISCLSIFGFLSKWTSQIPQFNFLQGINLSNFNTVGSWEALSIYLAVIIILILGQNQLTNNRQQITNIFLKTEKFLITVGCWLLIVGCLGLLVIIHFTLAWIILLIATGLLLFFKISEARNENLFKIYLIIITFTFSIVSLFFPLNKFIKIDLQKEIRLDNKISWQITGNVIQHRPILGVGPSAFIYNFSKYHSKEFNQNENWQIRFGKSGNYISELISSIGILGILIYLILIGIFLSLICRLPFIIYYFPVFFLFLSQFFYRENTVLNFCFWFFLSLSIANWKKIKPEIFKTQRFGHKILKNIPEFSVILNSILVLIFCGLLGVGYFAVQNYKAEALIKYGLNLKQQTENYSNQKIELFNQVLNLNPKQIYYQIGLIQAYLDKALTEFPNLKDQKFFEKLKEIVNLGINQIKKIQEMAPFDVKTAEIQGQFYRDIKIITSGATPLSIEGFMKAIKLEPNNPLLRAELGMAYMDLAEINKEKDLEKKSEESILNEKSFIEKIKKMKSSELIKLGQKEFNEVLELKNDFWLAKYKLALSYEKQGDVKKAIADLEKIVIDLNKEKKDDPTLFFDLGRLYFNQDRVDEAIKIFQMAIQLSPDYSNALYGLAIAYEKKNLYDQTLQTFQKLQQLNPGHGEIERKIIELKQKNNKTQKHKNTKTN
ncbi:tetratricopeptide repeat protein [Candidatus Kuenenbacteria bacterium]|nr:tetratricopeptide repeat protein [Candidatus Kuenenbacteria bacterium]